MKYNVGVVISFIVAAVTAAAVGFLLKPSPQVIKVGAVPVLNSPLEINGTVQHRIGVPLMSGSSTVCSIKLPNATTTIPYGGFVIRFKTVPYALSLTNGVNLATGATISATTTNLGFVTIGTTGESGLGIASTTNLYFPPNTFLTARVSTSTAVNANFAPSGDCQVFVQEV